MASHPDSGKRLNPIRVVLLGATGRMGHALVAALSRHSQVALMAVATRPESSQLGKVLEGTSLTVQTADQALLGADVAIDFSMPEACQHHVQLCRQYQVAYVSGVTGLNAEQLDGLHALAQSVPVLWAANMSLAVNACFGAAAQLAKSFASDLDVNILDIHHENKKDAPSGTALAFGEWITKANPTASITYESRREGAHPGEHLISYTSGDELIELRHRAGSREQFAGGAVQAAVWLTDKSPGMYKMTDLLNITTSS